MSAEILCAFWLNRVGNSVQFKPITNYTPVQARVRNYLIIIYYLHAWGIDCGHPYENPQSILWWIGGKAGPSKMHMRAGANTVDVV